MLKIHINFHLTISFKKYDVFFYAIVEKKKVTYDKWSIKNNFNSDQKLGRDDKTFFSGKI